ncbi:E3 ubiquitin-protein ligase TRIM71-like [Amphiura filiformis]|uniref:E3 ubiquitin-protein ligase TRIM71-like n=1 Tax=Amphiura filiformis TaxID=82378 RepID=UPI003B217986
MAQAKHVVTKDLTECGICLLTIEEPKALPCLHSYCLKCLSQWAQGKKDKVRCPICSQDFPIPPEGIKGFITNFVINTLKDRQELVERLHAKDTRAPCSCCGATDSKAEAYCNDCGGFICVDCARAIHSIALVFQDHKTIPCVDLQSGKVDIKSVMKKQCCKEHKGQVLRFYCKTCGVLLCHECTVIDHPASSHSLVNLKHATKEQRSEVKQLMKDCNKIQDMVDGSLKSADQVLHNLEKSLEKAKAELHQAADAARDKITQKEKEQEAELSQAAAVSTKQIEAQKESLQMQQTRLQTALQMATEVTQIGSDHDLALVFSSLKDNLHQLRDMKPGTVDENLGEMKFTTNPSMLSPTPSLGSVSIGSSKSRAPVSTGVKEEETSANSTYSKSSLSRGLIHGGVGTWKLINQFGDQGLQKLQKGRGTAVTQMGDFIAADQGHHLSGQPMVLVFSQSGNVKYSLDTKQGLKSEQTSRPWNVVVSQDGRIFITHRVSNINVYDQNGAYKYRFPTKSPSNVSSDAQDTMLCGLALDNQGCLLVGEMKQKYISKHRLDGSHVSSIKVTITPGYIAVTSTDKLIVSNGGWSTTAQVLDPTGNILQTLNRPSGVSLWCPFGICCTADDDIYIANHQPASNGGGIYCYSISGQYMGCITKEVYRPAGLTLIEDENKLLVVEEQRVKIFSRQ